ncbi:beta-lactamase family protein [Nocardia sp. NBC_00508]|uniref:serine hydrolase domain-containing protein n=1 Tax=Nocardia sp. NBC_00508 TaxID=2975992 RepID=UPI002E8203D4|nr:serine hydrolase domain-containing protein [Nocardia sp. NBC_00508]WUD67469.1 beta-lactamase family protein [Nocardia sp. NBC_00508]
MNITTDHTATVQSILDRAVTTDHYPGAFAEIRDGRSTTFLAAGVADTTTGRRPAAQDQFRVGSITKMFTATLILQLAAEYKLSLEDTVEKWLPGLVQGNGYDGDQITIRQLLDHTSGIFGYPMDEQLLDSHWSPRLLEHRFDTFTPEELVRIALTHPAYFEPGAGWYYSNTNFVLAAMIVERATGMSYPDAIEYRIVRALKLAGTYAPGADTGFRGPHLHNYSTLMLPDTDAPRYDVSAMSPTYAFGVGEIISTADDLGRFLSELLAGRILPPAQLEEMLTMTPVPDGVWLDGYSYGLGISSVTLPNGTTVYGHGGMIYGTWSYLYGTRDGHRIVAQGVNGDWGMPCTQTFLELMNAAFTDK